MKIYFDNCCLNRPYDDLHDNMVRMEAEAVLSVIDSCEAGEWAYFSSDVLLDEILGMPNADRRERVLLLYYSATLHIDLTDAVILRAKQLEQRGVKAYDALHLASAEAGGADILLTTDRRFMRVAQRSNTSILVRNPLVWLTEVLYDAKS